MFLKLVVYAVIVFLVVWHLMFEILIPLWTKQPLFPFYRKKEEQPPKLDPLQEVREELKPKTEKPVVRKRAVSNTKRQK
jgi:hypothetical protein